MKQQVRPRAGFGAAHAAFRVLCSNTQTNIASGYPADRIHTRDDWGCHEPRSRWRPVCSSPIPVVAHPGQDGSVPDGDPVAREPAASAGSPESLIGPAEIPGPGGVLQNQSSSVGSEGQAGPGLGAGAVDAVASRVPESRGRTLRRLMILLGLALAALVTGIWAVVLFPTPAVLTSSAPLTFTLDEGSGSSNIWLTISPSGSQSVKVAVQVIPLGLPGKVKAGQVALGFDLPDGRSAVSCGPGVVCSPFPELAENTFISMTFETEINGFTSPNQETFTVKDRRISATSNGESAIAELPAVLGGGSSGTSPPEVIVRYYIPNANTYDWSPPPVSVDRYSVTVPEQLSTTYSAEAVEVTGTSHQAQTQDNRNTFIAGILLGVAGAAAIAAVQEGLHMVFDNRDDGGRPKPTRPAKSS